MCKGDEIVRFKRRRENDQKHKYDETENMRLFLKQLWNNRDRTENEEITVLRKVRVHSGSSLYIQYGPL